MHFKEPAQCLKEFLCPTRWAVALWNISTPSDKCSVEWKFQALLKYDRLEGDIKKALTGKTFLLCFTIYLFYKFHPDEAKTVVQSVVGKSINTQK